MRIRLGGLDCFGPDGRPLPRAQLQHAVLRMLGSDHVAAAAAVAAAGPPPAAGPWALAQAGVFVGGQVAVGGQVVFGPAGAALGPAGAPGSPPPPAFSSLPPGTAPRRLPASTVWESEAFPVQQADELQQFDIGPALCVGGLLQVMGSMRSRACTLLGGCRGRLWRTSLALCIGQTMRPAQPAAAATRSAHGFELPRLCQCTSPSRLPNEICR